MEQLLVLGLFTMIAIDGILLVAAIAAHHKVKPENVVLGAGSQEILKSAMRA